MSHVSAIDVLYDGDCEQYARTMWNSMAKHAGDDGVRMDGEYTPGGGWQRFEWKQFSSPAMRGPSTATKTARGPPPPTSRTSKSGTIRADPR